MSVSGLTYDYADNFDGYLAYWPTTPAIAKKVKIVYVI
jgi:hypothetical protein